MALRISSSITLASLAVLGCSKAGERAERALEIPEKCFSESSAEKIFIGNSECLSALPPTMLEGVWILGPEYSVFKPSGAEGNTEIWLDVDPRKILPRFGLQYDAANVRSYSVKFRGTHADLPGRYGHFGLYKEGALVIDMIKLEERSDAKDRAKEG